MISPIIWISFLTILTSSNGYRLPTDVIPEHYDLRLLTLFEPEFKFKGNVEITTNCVRPATNITLHTQNLTIFEKDLKIEDAHSRDHVKWSKIDYDDDKNFLIIHLEDPLKEDHKYRIKMRFEGVLNDGLAGFYRSSYNDQTTKEKKWLAVTQFEPTSARRAFPCFDEPAMKATFKISLGRHENYTSLSNMPLLYTDPVKNMDNWYWDNFENSVPMSTYLVAFIVSDFGYKQAETLKDGNDVTFRVWARKDALNQVDLALKVGPKALDYFEKFFDIKFPLPKQDMIAIPDFSSGAMENWGLITYRETALLYDSELSSTTSQHYVASVISHELAHQWFGNLVTMNWWTDIWLNEGFATYMAGLAVDNLFPTWNTLEEEVATNILNVFSFDALKTSHPVSVKIGNPNEIWEIFDTISYKKGSFLIRMMSLFLGEDVLRAGVKHYLEEHKYGNAEQDDLWHSLTEVAHKKGVLPKELTVKTVMDTWTLKTGYPIVTVTRNYKNGTADLKQERFLRDVIRTKENTESCWWIPLTYTTQTEQQFNDTRPKSWLSCANKDHTIDGLDEKEWILLNIQLSGLYKINYDEKNWQLLINTLKSDSYKDIPVLNRVQLIDDAAELAWVGLLNYNVFMDLVSYLKHEDQYLPWRSALSNLNVIDRQIRQKPAYGDFKDYMKNLLTPVYEANGKLHLKIDSEHLDTIKHQISIISRACYFGVETCVSEAKYRFKQWENNPNASNPIPKDLRSVIYCTALKHGGKTEWSFLWEQYKNSNVAEEKATILRALGCTKETWLLQRYLEWSITDDSGIRKQDSSSVFNAVASNDVGFFIAKHFLFVKFNQLRGYLAENTKRLTRYLTPLASSITNEKDYLEFEKFIERNSDKLSEVKQGAEQSLEKAKLNVQWQTKHYEQVEKILKNYSA